MTTIVKPQMVKLNRNNSGVSWGFRLFGGCEYEVPMAIHSIVRRSIADRCGLKPGDKVLAINGLRTRNATHTMAKQEIIRTGMKLVLVIMRDNLPCPDCPPQESPKIEMAPVLEHELQHSEPKIYQRPPANAPKVAPKPAANQSPAPEPAKQSSPPPANQPAPVKQSTPVQEPKTEAPPANQESSNAQLEGDALSATEVLSSPAFRECTKKESAPFSPAGAVKEAIPTVTHKQFNSPMGLYSAENLAQAYAQQTEGIRKEMDNLDLDRTEVGTKMSGTMQVLEEPEK